MTADCGEDAASDFESEKDEPTIRCHAHERLAVTAAQTREPIRESGIGPCMHDKML